MTRPHIDALAQRRCEDMARLNGVSDRVRVAGECDIEQLRILTQKRALVVCDCEGGELDLLRPDVVPGLRAADILVEMHDFIDNWISPELRARFAATHDITVIDTAPRNPADYPVLSAYDTADQFLALTEFRPTAMQWAFMTPKGALPGGDGAWQSDSSPDSA